MALFSRRKSERGTDDALSGGSAGFPEDSGEDPRSGAAVPADGPWDSEEVDDDGDDTRIDLGSLRVPAIDGM